MKLCTSSLKGKSFIGRNEIMVLFRYWKFVGHDSLSISLVRDGFAMISNERKNMETRDVYDFESITKIYL